MPGPTNEALEDLTPERVFISGRQEHDSRRNNRRLQRYRTGKEGRDQPPSSAATGCVSGRLPPGRAKDGQQIWTEWGILAYNADTLAVRAR